MYGYWDMECKGQNFLSFWNIFYPFTPLKTRKIKILREQKEKLPWDIIVLYRCNINDNHMMYRSWDTEHDGQYFLPFWTIFCTFTSLTTRKIKILKKKKKKKEKTTWRYYHFTHVYHKWQSHDVWFLIYKVWHKIFHHFGHFLPFHVPKNPKYQNFEKMKKSFGDIII